MRALFYRVFAFLTMVYLLIPEPVWAGGKKGKLLVHVADTRGLSGVFLYFSNMYNENLLMFGIWTVVVITALGSGLGFLMDLIMSRTGLDLTSRKLEE
jgi:hypothetical protein